jgi:hypothetical protein
MALREFEYPYFRSVLKGLIEPKVQIIPYIPAHRKMPARYLDHASGWAGIESILPELIERFQIKTDRCLEFGVESGYSAVALSSYFGSVTGVDTFLGDRHTGIDKDLYEETVSRLAPYDNIKLVRSDYRDYIQQDTSFYGLIHVDIIHTFADTLACGEWSVRHSRCTLFHDTQSYPTSRNVMDLGFWYSEAVIHPGLFSIMTSMASAGRKEAV